MTWHRGGHIGFYEAERLGTILGKTADLRPTRIAVESHDDLPSDGNNSRGTEVDAMSAEQGGRAKNEGVGAATDEGLVCNIIMIHL